MMELVVAYLDEQKVYRELTFVDMQPTEVQSEMKERYYGTYIQPLYIRPSEKYLKKLDRLEQLLSQSGMEGVGNLFREQRRKLFVQL